MAGVREADRLQSVQPHLILPTLLRGYNATLCLDVTAIVSMLLVSILLVSILCEGDAVLTFQ